MGTFVNKIKGMDQLPKSGGLKLPQPLPLRGPCAVVGISLRVVKANEYGNFRKAGAMETNFAQLEPNVNARLHSVVSLWKTPEERSAVIRCETRKADKYDW